MRILSVIQLFTFNVNVCSLSALLYYLYPVVLYLLECSRHTHVIHTSNLARHRGTLQHSQWIVSDNPGLACSGTRAWNQEQDRIVRRSSPSSSAHGAITQITPSIIVPLACRSPQLTSVVHLLYLFHFCIVIHSCTRDVIFL